MKKLSIFLTVFAFIFLSSNVYALCIGGLCVGKKPKQTEKTVQDKNAGNVNQASNSNFFNLGAFGAPVSNGSDGQPANKYLDKKIYFSYHGVFYSNSHNGIYDPAQQIQNNKRMQLEWAMHRNFSTSFNYLSMSFSKKYYPNEVSLIGYFFDGYFKMPILSNGSAFMYFGIGTGYNSVKTDLTNYDQKLEKDDLGNDIPLEANEIELKGYSTYVAVAFKKHIAENFRVTFSTITYSGYVGSSSDYLTDEEKSEGMDISFTNYSVGLELGI